MIDKKTHLHQYCETNKRSRLNYEDRVFVCRNCKAAFGHHVIWCPNCPGRCEQVTYRSYEELFNQTGEEYEWGETRLWDEYHSLRQRKFDAERKGKTKEPCVVYFWISGYEKDKFEKLVTEYGYKEYQQGEPTDTGERSQTVNDKGIIYEYKFLFDGWVDAHSMVYRKFVGITTNYTKDYIFNGYRKRMKEVTP